MPIHNFYFLISFLIIFAELASQFLPVFSVTVSNHNELVFDIDLVHVFKVGIGLDIGTTSVGWAVVEADTQNVIKKGSGCHKTASTFFLSCHFLLIQAASNFSIFQGEVRKSLDDDMVSFL